MENNEKRDRDEKHHVHRLQPIIHEKRYIQNKNFIFALIIGLLVIAVEFFFVYFFELNLRDSLIIAFILVVFYGVFLLFLIEPRVVREIHNLEIKTIEREKPVIKEVVRDVPVMVNSQPIVKEVVKTIEKPVYVEKPVYYEVPRQKLDIPKYDFVGSSETRTFHTRNCRLGKLIKKKYKVSGNNKNEFTRKGFSPCKVCILREKKV